MTILTVTQLTHAIKKNLEGTFFHISVQGEVSNLRLQSSGHLYFTLKDEGAQIAAVLFKGNALKMERLPKEGDQIVVKGELSVYAPRGNYQIIIREIAFSGVGELLQKLHLRKLKLQQLGWFDAERKKAIPKIPKTIGVITSPTGSVIQDIINILTRRFPGFHLILNPVKVQGEGAAEEIAKAIEECNHHKTADVLIVGRGGGSLEDLWPFNEEIVAKAILDSSIPIISAIGHETDFTIADFVADVRAPTPSAAAELVCIEKKDQLVQLEKIQLGLAQRLRIMFRSSRQLLQSFIKQPLLSSPYVLLGPYFQKIDEMKEDLQSSISMVLQQNRFKIDALKRQAQILKPSAQIGRFKQQFIRWDQNCYTVMKKILSRKKERLQQLSAHLRAIDPRNLLKKGFSIVFREKKDSVILSRNDVEKDEVLRIKLSDGQVAVTVKEKL